MMWTFAFLLIALALQAQAYHKVCYYTNWSQYRAGAEFWPENIDGSLCTHINFAFADMNGNQLTTVEYNDEDLELDFINLMSYDLNGSWNPYTGFNSPLWARADETGGTEQHNVDWAASYWVQMGTPPAKLVVGTGHYGRSFQLEDPNQNGLGAPSIGAGDPAPYTNEAGYIAYFEICAMIDDPTWTKVYSTEQEAPYLYKGDQWIGYDDVRSLEEKVAYIEDRGYGGAMIWATDLDDYNAGFCGQGAYPLHNVINTLP